MGAVAHPAQALCTRLNRVGLDSLTLSHHHNNDASTKLLQLLSSLSLRPTAQGFSGTKMDTTIEASMAQLMRGGPADDNANDPFRAQKCVCQMADDGAHAANCTGRWLRTLNKQKVGMRRSALHTRLGFRKAAARWLFCLQGGRANSFGLWGGDALQLWSRNPPAPRVLRGRVRARRRATCTCEPSPTR
jgi:hypothetical protein